VGIQWQIGNRICQGILKEKRADYGRKIVVTLSRQLTEDYGNNFYEKNLRRMIQFAEVFPDKEIVVSLIRQLSWTHFIALIPLKDDLQRDFYAEMCRIERWSDQKLY
jgi:hypothetical protein